MIDHAIVRVRNGRDDAYELYHRPLWPRQRRTGRKLQQRAQCIV